MKEDNVYHGNGNLLQHAKYIKKAKIDKTISVSYDTVDSAAHNDRLNRFAGRQGHGFAAEQANHLIDSVTGKDATILGDDNMKNGPDRMVNGSLIQSKYCQSANMTVEAAFRNGKYRYLDTNGNPMQLEVPSDQYKEAVNIMRQKILKGKVPGTTNPDDAEKLIRKGNIDYKTACNIAKAGTVDSLLFDAAHGAVIATNAFGISATIVFAKSLWDGENFDKAIDTAMYAGLQAGGVAFATSVVTAQLTRTGINQIMLRPATEIVKILPNNIRQSMMQALRNGSLAYGSSAGNNLAKLIRSNIITNIAVVLVLSAKDITQFFRGRISAKQLFKDVMTIASGAGGGAVLGAAASALIPVPGAFVVGGMIGATLGTKGASTVLNHFIEDDAVALLEIINKKLISLSQEYLLSEEELNIIIEDIKQELVHEKLLQMYASEDKNAFAENLLRICIEKTTKWRVKVNIPSNEILLKSLSRVLELSNDRNLINNYFKKNSVDTVKIGKELLGKNLDKKITDKAWYVTKQMNMLQMQQEASLINMKENEEKYIQRNKQLKEEIDIRRRILQKMIEGDK